MDTFHRQIDCFFVYFQFNKRSNDRMVAKKHENEVVKVIQLVMYHGSRLKEQSRQTRSANESQQ